MESSKKHIKKNIRPTKQFMNSKKFNNSLFIICYSKKFIALLLIVLVALVSFFALTYKRTPVAKADWYSSTSWHYRQRITIGPDKVTNTDQTDFPVLIKIADASNQIFTKARDDGYDLVFTDSNNVKLSHEIETFSKSSKELLAWVKVPTLSVSTNTVINLYYGNLGAVDQQNKAGVWTNGYAGVWHLPNGSALSTADSLGVYNLTNTGPVSATAGKFFGGANGFASGKGLTATAGASVNSTDWTAEGWIYRTATPSYSNTILGHGPATASAGHWMFYANSNNRLDIDLPYVKGNVVVGNTTVAQGQWVHVVATKSGNVYSLYYNGSPDGTVTDPVANVVTGNISVGNTAALNHPFLGSMDELRISSTARSADWIATEYTNQSAPDTFISLNAEEFVDSVAPTNPQNLSQAKDSAGGSIALSTSNFYNYPAPYFAWPEAGQAGGASDNLMGVAGYYLYFGTSCGDSGADPALARGILSDIGGGLHYTTGTNVEIPSIPADGTYCLRIKTKDNVDNISSASELFAYKYEATVPTAPAYIASNPAGYSSTNSFAFTWPVASDIGGSGIAGYQYKRGGSSGDVWSSTITQNTIGSIQAYQTGENIIIVRSIDNAGNVSAEAQTNYYYASNAPAKPTDLTASPVISDENSFSFSWAAPAHGVGIENYGYSLNAPPTAQNVTWTVSNATTLAAGPFATKQGVNTLYLVAKDEAGNYAFDQANYATVDFTCQTAAPPAPMAVTAVDSSDRSINRWMITAQWAAGPSQDSGTFDHYLIERSTDGSTFTELATTTSTAYIDADLSNAITYSYRIIAVDNAGGESVASAIVSKIPTGNYPTPPTIVTDPTSEVKATSATVSWVTNRVSTGAVKFGTSQDKLDRSQLDAEEETSHQIVLPGLEPATIYYFKVQSLDSARDYSDTEAYSSIFTLKTLPAPGIQNVKITNISLNSADISWETSSASTSLVRYGTSINYDKNWEEATSFTTKHTYKLKDLTHTTTYHFKISGLDGDDNSINSDDYVFDTLPMPKISAVSFDTDYSEAEPQTSISWTSNVPTTSSVEYFPKSGGAVSYEESQSDLITAHKVKLTKLSDDTSYSFYVSGTDQFGNKSTSDEFIFNTPFDSRPAKISDVQVEPSNVGLDKQDKAQLIVSWRTDELATTQVEYGEGVSGDYTSKTSEDKTLTNEHFVIISDLQPNKTYHLRAISRDKGGNESLGEDTNTIPGEVPRSLLKVLFSTFDNIFGWLGKLL